MDFHPELELTAWVAVFVDPHIACGNAFHALIAVVQDLSRSKAWEDLHTQALGLLGQPLCEFTQADDVVSVVLKTCGQQPIGCAPPPLLREEHERIFSHLLVQRRTTLTPVGKQFIERFGVHDGPRQGVRPSFSAFFKNSDRNFLAIGLGQLLQVNGAGQSRGSCTHNQNVIVHRFAWAKLRKNVCGVHGGCQVVDLAIILVLLDRINRQERHNI